MIKPICHLLLHFLVPAAIARLAFPERWGTAWLLMTVTMLVDLDHLLATPIFDPGRCSLGFHPLHSAPAIGFYTAVLLIPKLRLVAVGLIVHMMLDWSDCIWIKWS